MKETKECPYCGREISTDICPHCYKSPCPKCVNLNYKMGEPCSSCGYQNKFIHQGYSFEETLFAMKKEKVARDYYNDIRRVRAKVKENDRLRTEEYKKETAKRQAHIAKYNQQKPPQKKRTWWQEYSGFIWLILSVFIYAQFANSCSSGGSDGPTYPLDHTNESAEYRADMMEQDQRDYDPATEYDNEYHPPDEDFAGYPDIDPDTLTMSCPTGCTTHVNGCDIKGNISQEGVKIYHVPGQEYYSATRINTTYGERWFCTEAEARSNGWRKSKK